MAYDKTRFTLRKVVASMGAAALLIVAGCGDFQGPHGQANQGAVTAQGNSQGAADIAGLPKHGKQRLAGAPAKAVFGMIYINTTENREYIYDGGQWVPHDQTVEAYYETHAKRNAELTQDEVCLDGDPACTPSGAHGKHDSWTTYGNNCKICHKVGGRLVFDKNGPAYAAASPAPSFDATAKNCSNVACHGVPTGTFSYYFPDGSGDPQLYTVTYSSAPRPTPSWNSTVAGCTACHDDPPKNGSNGGNAWHSGYHGGQGPTGARNQCQFCHPDASSPGNGIGNTITNPTLHANGTVNVQAPFTSQCFNCH